MRSDHIIILVCLLLIWKLATRTTGAALTTPPDEPKTSERPAAKVLHGPGGLQHDTEQALKVG
jgi:hypothetical protein